MMFCQNTNSMEKAEIGNQKADIVEIDMLKSGNQKRKSKIES
jgi:hypothetical protein